MIASNEERERHTCYRSLNYYVEEKGLQPSSSCSMSRAFSNPLYRPFTLSALPSTIRNEETSKSLLKPSNKDACDWMVESLYSLGYRHEMILFFLITNVQSCSLNPPPLLGHQFS